jgi:hypothetical protein
MEIVRTSPASIPLIIVLSVALRLIVAAEVLIGS